MLCLRHNLQYWKIFFNLISCASIWLLPFNIYIIRIYLIYEIVSVSPSHPYNIWYSLWYYGFSVFQATLWFHSHFQVAYIFKNTYSPDSCFVKQYDEPAIQFLPLNSKGTALCFQLCNRFCYGGDCWYIFTVDSQALYHVIILNNNLVVLQKIAK